jgi:hypothetical protein
LYLADKQRLVLLAQQNIFFEIRIDGHMRRMSGAEIGAKRVVLGLDDSGQSSRASKKKIMLLV